MKKILFLLAGLIGSTSIFAQIDDKTLVKTLEPGGSSTIEFDFPLKDLDATSWKNDNRTLRVELEIHANMNEEILQRLIKAGRYTMEGRIEGDKFIITAPNIEKRVTIGGIDLQEDLFVHAKTPDSEPFTAIKNPKEGTNGRFVLQKDIDKMLSMSRKGKTKKDLKPEELALMSKINVSIKIHPTIKLVQKDKVASASKKTKDKDKNIVTARGTESKNIAPATGAPPKSAKHGDILIDGVKIDYD